MIISTKFQPTHDENPEENGDQGTPPPPLPPPRARTAWPAARAHSRRAAPLVPNTAEHTAAAPQLPRDRAPPGLGPAGGTQAGQQEPRPHSRGPWETAASFLSITGRPSWNPDASSCPLAQDNPSEDERGRALPPGRWHEGKGDGVAGGLWASEVTKCPFEGLRQRRAKADYTVCECSEGEHSRPRTLKKSGAGGSDRPPHSTPSTTTPERGVPAHAETGGQRAAQERTPSTR